MTWRLAILLLLFFNATGCLLRKRGPELPDENSITRDQLVIYADFVLPRRHRLINELVALRGDLASKLQLPMSDELIHVYLFETARDYREFMAKNYPGFLNRRAFFVKTDTTLAVYAFWGDRVAEDLRHEVAHGYLHSVVPHLPLWLDEGLAEYFEVRRGMRGVNRGHADLLLGEYNIDRWTPDIRRLEKLRDAAELTQMDYAESWLWAHLLMETTPERLEIIQKHVAQLKNSGDTRTISDVLDEQDSSIDRTLIQHLKSIAK